MSTPAVRDYSAEGTKAEDPMNHMIAKTYEIAPADLVKEHGGVAIHLRELQTQFVKHCPDYMDVLGDGKSQAFEFCSKILYEVGPASRKVKRGTGDKTWKFIFQVKDSKHVVFVSTYKEKLSEYKADFQVNYMTLTLKQAALLAHETFGRAVHKAIQPDEKQILLTPLAGACFSRNDIPALAVELRQSTVDTAMQINQSTQSGGQVLKHGDVDFAICAVNFATRNLKDEKIRKSIVTKTREQYIAVKKMPNKARINIIERYATGGVPAEFAYEELIKVFELNK